MNAALFRFFGPGLIVDAEGQPLALRSRKQLALLAYLATEHVMMHSRETLQALFWPDDPTPTAQNNLRVTLSRLRAVAARLALAGAAPPALLVTDRHNVQIDPAWIDYADTNRFNRLLERSQQHEHTSRSQCAHCQTLLRQAVQLYQGEFLEGIVLNECNLFEEWLFMQRERLWLLMLDAYADLTIYAESNDDLPAARATAQRQLELDPLRESAYRQQMRILAKLGERNAALVLFERCRTVLRQELGLDPEAETLALHTQLLNPEAAADANVAPLPTMSPALPFATPHPGASPEVSPARHNFPEQLTPFFGREEEIAALQARLANPTYRLLSIVGPGGIGKSRLAQQVAAQQVNNFRDGGYFVALAQAPTAASIPLAIAETLQLSLGAGAKSVAEQLCEMLGNKQLLLVLDNFEHLIEGVNLLVALLQQAPQVVLLVTSRERLNLQAEDLFELHGLAVPTSSTEAAAPHFAAVRLFVDRAHRLNKHFKLTAEQLPHVVRICQLAEGFPLAIELAATWIRDLNCKEIVVELNEGLDRLETTARDIDPQHRSLRAVFNASWQLLSTLEQRTLAKLAVFSGGFTQDAARAVTGATPALLSALRNKSLLRHAGSRRYDMHALIHQFAAAALAHDASVAEATRRAHSHYFLTLLADQAVALDTRAAGAASALIQPDWENMTIAWQRATAQMELHLLQNALDGLFRFCDLRGLYPEAQTLFESTVARLETPLTSLASADEMPRLKLHCRLLAALVYVAECRGQFARTQELSQQALALATALDSKAEIISIHLNQAKAFELVADYAQGIALAEQMLALAQAEGLELQAGICMELIGYNAYRLGDYERAHEMYHRLLAFHEWTGRLELPTRLAISILGSMAIDQGRYEAGLIYCQRFLASSQATGDHINIAQAYNYLARAWNHLGDFNQAVALADQSILRLDLLGDMWIKGAALLNKSFAHRQLGELAEALIAVTDAVALVRIHGSPTTLADALAQLAATQMALAARTQEWTQAAANFHEAATRLRASNELIKACEAEIGLAELAYRRDALPDALSQITPIVPHLPTTNAEGWDEPIRAYVVCIRILQAVDEPAAEKLLAQALTLLNGLAQNITDESYRHTFLHAVPAHRSLRTVNLGTTPAT
ncbi:BTAD domain-containing putative transcriptional regulator [Caldilinea sp.]|uniref:AfsR/SARP family transcriptional regulator n=1 Tax=Caldilinea sp. TaxID=2293560 RepID=UPI002BE9C1E3|nr:BTAD domain-containing putative transcriptional regulator [Caldilinea sp.]